MGIKELEAQGERKWQSQSAETMIIA